MVDVLDRTEVGVLDVRFTADGPISALAIAQFLEALARAAEESVELGYARLEIAEVRSGSILMRLVARLRRSDGKNDDKLGRLADATQVAGFLMLLLGGASPAGPSTHPVAEAGCRFVIEHQGGRIEMSVPEGKCMVIDQAFVAALEAHRAGGRGSDTLVADLPGFTPQRDRTVYRPQFYSPAHEEKTPVHRALPDWAREMIPPLDDEMRAKISVARAGLRLSVGDGASDLFDPTMMRSTIGRVRKTSHGLIGYDDLGFAFVRLIDSRADAFELQQDTVYALLGRGATMPDGEPAFEIFSVKPIR